MRMACLLRVRDTTSREVASEGKNDDIDTTVHGFKMTWSLHGECSIAGVVSRQIVP
jgi:hypothetical protein